MSKERAKNAMVEAAAQKIHHRGEFLCVAFRVITIFSSCTMAAAYKSILSDAFFMYTSRSSSIKAIDSAGCRVCLCLDGARKLLLRDDAIVSLQAIARLVFGLTNAICTSH
jgi:hypothetical protein